MSTINKAVLLLCMCFFTGVQSGCADLDFSLNTFPRVQYFPNTAMPNFEFIYGGWDSNTLTGTLIWESGGSNTVAHPDLEYNIINPLPALPAGVKPKTLAVGTYSFVLEMQHGNGVG